MHDPNEENMEEVHGSERTRKALVQGHLR